MGIRVKRLGRRWGRMLSGMEARIVYAVVYTGDDCEQEGERQYEAIPNIPPDRDPYGRPP